MRRVVILLSALVFAFAVSGDAFAKDGKGNGKKKPEPLTTEEKAANKERAKERELDKEDAGNKSGPLIRLHSSSGGKNSKPDSSWLHEKNRRGY